MSQEPSSDENILHEWLNTSTQTINVVVLEWGYGVSGSNPKGTPLVTFQWEGVATTASKQQISVNGEFIIMVTSVVNSGRHE